MAAGTVQLVPDWSQIGWGIGETLLRVENRGLARMARGLARIARRWSKSAREKQSSVLSLFAGIAPNGAQELSIKTLYFDV